MRFPTRRVEYAILLPSIWQDRAGHEPGSSPVTSPESARGSGLQLQELLDLGHWFDAIPGQPSQIYLVAVIGFTVWTIASIYLYYFRRKIFAGNGALIGMATRFGPYAIAIGLIGLFLLAMRYAGIPYISVRFLLYVTILAAIGYLGFLVYYLRRRYPARLAEVRAAELRRRYAPERKRGKRRR